MNFVVGRKVRPQPWRMLHLVTSIPKSARECCSCECEPLLRRVCGGKKHASHGERGESVGRTELKSLHPTSMPQTMVAPSIEVFVRSPAAGNGGLVDDFQRRMGCMSRTVSRVQISAKSENIFGDTLADYILVGWSMDDLAGGRPLN